MSKYYRFEITTTSYVDVKARDEEHAWDIMSEDGGFTEILPHEVEWNLDCEVTQDEAESGIFELLTDEEDTDEQVQSEVS
jgi:hypothetical protein